MTRAPAPLEITGYAFLSMLGLYMLCVGGTNSWDVDERQKSLVGPAEISAMQAGVIKFGSHTCTHGSLSDMQPTEILLGLTHSCATHMALVGRPVVTLAYPHNKQNSTVRVRAWQAGRLPSSGPLPRTVQCAVDESASPHAHRSGLKHNGGSIGSAANQVAMASWYMKVDFRYEGSSSSLLE
jgi:hypothetical protein